MEREVVIILGDYSLGGGLRLSALWRMNAKKKNVRLFQARIQSPVSFGLANPNLPSADRGRSRTMHLGTARNARKLRLPTFLNHDTALVNSSFFQKGVCATPLKIIVRFPAQIWHFTRFPIYCFPKN
jgi:hypothetical protein